MPAISNYGNIPISKVLAGNTIFVNPNAGQDGLSPLGGGQRWPDKVYQWFKRGNATQDYGNRRIVVAAGQVLKRGTVLQSLPNGQMTAHGAFTQNNTILLSGSMAAGDTLKINNITFTATQTLTPLQVAQIWEAYSQVNSPGYPSIEASLSESYNTLLQASNGAFTSLLGTTNATAWIPGWNFVVDLATVAEYQLSENTDGGSIPAIGLIAESQGFIAPTTALVSPTYTGSTLTVSVATTTGTSVSGTSLVQLAGSLTAGAVVIGGVTFTFNTNAASAAQIAAAIALVPAGASAAITATSASTMPASNGLITSVSAGTVYNNAATPVAIGTLSGTNTGWNFSNGANSGSLQAVATAGNSVSGVLITSTGTGITLQASAQNTANPVAGILMFDVNANINTGTLAVPIWTPNATAAAMWTDGDFYAEGIQWENHPVPNSSLVPISGYITSPQGAGFTGETSGYDYVVNADGTATACTAYWTGVQTLLDAQKLFENTIGSSWFTLGSWQERAGEIEP